MHLVSYTSVPSYDMDITSDVFSLYVYNEDTLFEAMKDSDDSSREEALMSVLEQVKW